MPVAVLAWYAVGFGPWWASAQAAATTWPGRALPALSGAGIAAVAIGGAVGGLVAGLLVRRFLVAVPLALGLGTGLWMLGRSLPSAVQVESGTARGVLVVLLVTTGLGAALGALGSHRSVPTAIALALPVATYAVLPGSRLADSRWTDALNGWLVAIGLALLLYAACWRTGWRAIGWWPLVAGAYLAAFAALAAAATAASVAARYTPDGHAGRRQADAIADGAMDSFVGAFLPFLRLYWPWLGIAVFLAVMMVALKIRALPPKPPPVPVIDDRGNDAYLSDDLDWIDRTEPRRRLVPRRGPAA